VTVSVTVYVPAALYVWLGLFALEFPPSPKFHSHVAPGAFDVFLNLIVRTPGRLQVKPATGCGVGVGSAVGVGRAVGVGVGVRVGVAVGVGGGVGRSVRVGAAVGGRVGRGVIRPGLVGVGSVITPVGVGDGKKNDGNSVAEEPGVNEGSPGVIPGVGMGVGVICSKISSRDGVGSLNAMPGLVAAGALVAIKTARVPPTKIMPARSSTPTTRMPDPRFRTRAVSRVRW